MKNILVTGANKGIGFAIVERILEEADDTYVFLGSRDSGRGEAAVDKLLQAHADFTNRIEMLEIDVSSDESVQRAAEIVRSQCADDGLYGIVNNAGIGFGSSDLSSVLNVNTRGIHRICAAFIPLLIDGGRIVNITSAAGPNFVAKCGPNKQAFFTNANVTWNEIDALMKECVSIAGDTAAFTANGLADGSPYGLSKALANSCTLQLARENPNLIINACTPGYIATDLTVHSEEDRRKNPEELGMKSPREGANSAIFLLFGESLGSGHYYGSDAQRSPLDHYRAPGSPPYSGD
ncbi:MAG: SDR family NAD(P)-dependent oxidoreductase [Pseudomonadota bacterium]